MQTYTPLEDKLRTTGDVVTLSCIRGKEHQERIEALTMFLLEAAEYHYDVTVTTMWSHVSDAVSDMYLLPFAQSDGRRNANVLPYDYPDGSAYWRARLAWAEARAEIAMGIYGSIPKGKIRSERNHDRDRHDAREFIEYIDPTLPKAKEALLLAVADGWKLAASDELSDKFFDFIRTAHLHGDQDWKSEKDEPGKVNIRRQVLRASTDGSFPAGRLMRALSRLGALDRDDRRTVVVLMAAWARNASLHGIPLQFGLMEPLSHPVELAGRFGRCDVSSNAAFAYGRSLLEKVKAVERPVLALREHVGGFTSTIEFDPGSNPDFPTVILTINDKFKSETADIAHEMFDGYRRKAESWLAEHNKPSKFRVELRFTATHQWKNGFVVNRSASL